MQNPRAPQQHRSATINMILRSPYSPGEIINILKEEIDDSPSNLRTIVSLNAHYFSGTSEVCGSIKESGFQLRNRSGAHFSLIADCSLFEIEGGAEIQVDFKKPFPPDLIGVFIFRRYKYDRIKILTFLEDYLKTTEKAEQGSSQGFSG